MVEALAIGTFTVDVIAVDLPKIASPGEVVYVTRPIDLHVGGHAANVSIDLVKLGVIQGVVASGALGRDVFAHLIEHELRKYGVVVAAETISEAGTARNMILVVKGEDRRFHVYRGANQYLSANHVLRLIDKYKPRFMYLSVGASRRLDSRLNDIILKAKDNNTVVLLDIAYTEPRAVKVVDSVLELPDIVHLNSEELAMLTGEQDVEKALSSIRARAPMLLCVTSGSRGLMALYKRRILVVQPPFRVELEDPTGAGDAFSAGLLSALKTTGKSLGDLATSELVKMLLFAQASGAIAVTAAGATTAVSGISVRRLIEAQGNRIIASTRIVNLY